MPFVQMVNYSGPLQGKVRGEEYVAGVLRVMAHAKAPSALFLRQ